MGKTPGGMKGSPEQKRKRPNNEDDDDQPAAAAAGVDPSKKAKHQHQAPAAASPHSSAAAASSSSSYSSPAAAASASSSSSAPASDPAAADPMSDYGGDKRRAAPATSSSTAAAAASFEPRRSTRVPKPSEWVLQAREEKSQLLSVKTCENIYNENAALVKASGQKMLQSSITSILEHKHRYNERLKGNFPDDYFETRKFDPPVSSYSALNVDQKKTLKSADTSKVTEADGEMAALIYMASNYPEAQLLYAFSPGQGIDQIWFVEDGQSKLTTIYIVEAKGVGAKLSTDAKKGAQMGTKWVINSIKEMVDKAVKKKPLTIQEKKITQALLDCLDNDPKPAPPPSVIGMVIQQIDKDNSDAEPICSPADDANFSGDDVIKKQYPKNWKYN